MTKENLVFICNEYPNHVLSFINENINQYVDITDDEILSLQEFPAAWGEKPGVIQRIKGKIKRFYTIEEDNLWGI